VLRGFSDIHAKGYSGSGKESAEATQLVLGQSVHRVDDDGTDASGFFGITEFQAFADDGIKETLSLAGTRTGGNQSGSSGSDGSDGIILMAIDVSNFCGYALPHVRVEQALANEILNARALAERAGEAYIWALEQRRLPGFLKRKQSPHLCVQACISEWICRELIAQETAHDLFGENDRIQSHI
jgi:hypothetical protein